MPSAHYIISSIYQSPVGPLRLGSTGDRLCLCEWTSSGCDTAKCYGVEVIQGRTAVIEQAERELNEYFEGRRKVFDVATTIIAASDFRADVFAGLQGIGFGKQITYADLARSLGRASSVRAVASACGHNPLMIFVPCHRVVGSGGAIGGYAGGREIKAALLDLESRFSRE